MVTEVSNVIEILEDVIQNDRILGTEDLELILKTLKDLAHQLPKAMNQILKLDNEVKKLQQQIEVLTTDNTRLETELENSVDLENYEPDHNEGYD